MLNIEKIFEEVKPVDHRRINSKKKHKISISGNIFCSDSIFLLLEHIQFIRFNNLKNFHLKILINTKYIADESTLIVFEIIIYYLLKNNICDVTYTFVVDKNLLGYGSLIMSNLFPYNTKLVNREKFINIIEQETHIFKNHFRKICYNNEENREGIFLSKLITDITTFLSAYNIEESYCEELAEIVTEIVGNSLEHSRDDCLLDLKIVVDKINKYKNVSVTTISIGDTFIGSNIKDYIYDSENVIYSPRNKIVLEALENHKNYFDEYYNIDTFSMVSAFQKYVTTRKHTINSGGTGLTTLIKQLKSRARADYCYVLSGKDIILFREPYLDLTSEGLIGFNKENNYLQNIPSKEIVMVNTRKFNGTIYNLSFILDERNEDDE